MIAAEMNNRPIQRYENEIMDYLQSTAGDPFFKTLILNVLKEHQYDNPVYIEKFDRNITVIPDQMNHLSDNAQLTSLLKVLTEKLEDEDPIFYGNIKSLVERHSFLTYPFPLKDLNITAWAAAYHIMGNEYHGIYKSMDEMLEIYGEKYEEVEEALSIIRMIEEVSYLNL